MARSETYRGKQGVVDQGLEVWQKWNKFTLTAEGVVVAMGLIFGVPGLITLGAVGAAIDGTQYLAINEIQKRRARKQSGIIYNATLKREEKVRTEVPKEGKIVYLNHLATQPAEMKWAA